MDILTSARRTLLGLCEDQYAHTKDTAELAEIIAVRFIARGITIERLQAEIKALKNAELRINAAILDDAKPVPCPKCGQPSRLSSAGGNCFECCYGTAPAETPLGDDIDGGYPV